MCFAFGFVRHCGFGGDIAFEVHLSSRLYRRVCLWFTPVFFPLSGKKRRLAVSCVSIPRVEIAFVRSRSVGAVICLCGFTSGLCVSLWRSRRVTGVRRTGIRGRRCGLCAFLRRRIGLGVFPRGVRWGCAPQTAPKSLRLSGLSSGAGRVRKCVSRGGAVLVRVRASRHPGTRKDPPGSNLWPGGSGCIEMIPTRSNVQTRAAPKRRGVGLQRAKRCGSRHCRHCRP